MNKPLLSICIPTYNRASFLQECLESIVTQYKNPDVFEQVEIVISDNASDDDTTNVVENFQKQFSNISYYRNDTNVGFDKNILNVVEKSTGTYIFTLWDDDALFPDTLAYIIKELTDTTCSYFFLNSWGYNRQLTAPASAQPAFEPFKKVQYDTLQYFVESITVYQDVVGYFAGMSSQLFLRKDWIAYPNKKEFIGTQVVHLFILLSTFQGSRFCILPKPIVKTRANNIRWETYPGLETARGRAEGTLKTALWIQKTYSLTLSVKKLKVALYSQIYVGAGKSVVKKVLRTCGINKW